MNKTKNSKIVLVLSVFLIFLIIGSASAADDTDEIGNETILTSTMDVDTVNNAVDEEVSAAETESFGSDDISIITLSENTDSSAENVLKSNNETDVLNEEEKSTEGSFTDFSLLIQSTVDGGTLHLEKNYAFDSTKDYNLTISKSITIEGNGMYLNSNNMNFFITIAGSKVTFKNIHFMNFNSFTPFLWTGSNGKISNCTFQDSYAGGFICWEGDNGLVEYSNFNSIKSGDYKLYGSTSAASSDSVSGIYITGANVKVDNCNFTNNQALTKIYWAALGSQNSILSNCYFINNTCTSNYYIGTSYFQRCDGEIINCHYINNSLNNGGFTADIPLLHANVKISNCTFEGTKSNRSVSQVIYSSIVIL